MGGNLRHEASVLATADAVENTWSFVSEAKGFMHRVAHWKARQPGAGEEDGRFGSSYLPMFMVAAVFCLVCLPGIILYKSYQDIAHQEEEDHIATEAMQNKVAKELRREFTKECTDENERKKYTSAAFRKKASQVFEDIDKTDSGKLDLKLLTNPVKQYLGIETQQDVKWWSETYMKAFDDNGDKEIEKEEFVHLLRCLQWKKDRKDAQLEIAADAM